MQALAIIAEQDARMRRVEFTVPRLVAKYPQLRGVLTKLMGIQVVTEDGMGEVFEPRFDVDRRAVVVSLATPIGSRALTSVACAIHTAVLIRDRPLRSTAAAAEDDDEASEQADRDAAAKEIAERILSHATAVALLPPTDSTAAPAAAAKIDVTAFLSPWDREDTALVATVQRLVDAAAPFIPCPAVTYPELAAKLSQVKLPKADSFFGDADELKAATERANEIGSVADHVSGGLEALRWRCIRGAIDGTLDDKVAMSVKSLANRLHRRRLDDVDAVFEPPVPLFSTTSGGAVLTTTADAAATVRKALERASALPAKCIERLREAFGGSDERWYAEVLRWEAAVLEAEFRAMGGIVA